MEKRLNVLYIGLGKGESIELREVENSKKEENNGLRGDIYLTIEINEIDVQSISTPTQCLNSFSHIALYLENLFHLGCFPLTFTSCQYLLVL